MSILYKELEKIMKKEKDGHKKIEKENGAVIDIYELIDNIAGTYYLASYSFLSIDITIAVNEYFSKDIPSSRILEDILLEELGDVC